MNEEYISYVDYLKSINFENKLEKLKIKYEDKKVVLFGQGPLLDAILDNYDIKNSLNVIGISDKRIETQAIAEYKGYKVYKPIALRALNVNVVLDTNILFADAKKYLKKNNYLRANVLIEKMVEIPFSERFEDFLMKQKAVFNFLIESKNIFKTFYYAFFSTTEEIICKVNYIKKWKALRASNKPIRTAFVCNESSKTDFMGIYNILSFDKNFKLFPIIITPEILLESDVVDEEKQEKRLQYFNTFNTQVIDDWDRQTHSLPSLHAFKPDLIFYQNPIYIKDDYNPLKMSKNALTFTVEFDVRNADFVALGSQYFRKQASNLWKIFVNNLEDKKLYSEYTDLTGKSIVQVVNNNINSGVVKCLKKLLNRA